MSTEFDVPLIIRGEIIESDGIEYGGRRGGVAFRTPDVAAHIAKLPLRTPSMMADLYALRFEDILDFLVALGDRLDVAQNRHIQQAFALSCRTSGLSESILRHHYAHIGAMFDRTEMRAMMERSCGVDYLEGWVDQGPSRFPGLQARTRAFGSRCVHVIAGNAPIVSILTVIRNALTRSDAIIKTPSNDPLTAAAIVRTMAEMAPDHPVTKHITVAYWKGGDERIEQALYDPRGVEKIVAWGGFDSVKHITRYLQPGIDLITQDPKLSGTIIGKEAFADDATLASVARRLALDIGAQNQEGCVSARVIYVESGTDEEGLERANRLGQLTFTALQALPEHLSTPHKAFDQALKSEIDAIRLQDEDFRVFGGRGNEGAVIVSQEDYPVDFSRTLACRVGNIVPIDSVETAVRSVNAYTQTVGIYPEALKTALRDRLAFQGAQRIVSLGGAATMQHNMERQDAIEPVRRMCKWVTEEEADGRQLETLAG
ncbi:long-chain-fatty-acyl-CoA reductase [Sphingomonas sp. CGMCC 1.13654]|uniref:long-chain-fatty-acyl-CoA reductase n=1 Tax=Sphingomonas chungangi TaxID=2683589 RepID=A0A838L5A1_9SPHN|nr:acyl-CoA reductase [Sphingomonas chungangi]MBA2933639.1 long-chain-fatty-acyl-CoA reductase [Sphingomonas chungangi]MVW54971.1 long-chain-fatty-acyl-CoA reductase [Sphingomonas chungangi]